MKKTITYGNPPTLPTKLNPESYYREIEMAGYALGKLQVAHGKIANSNHLIKPLITREATVSSKIEGTITESEDVFVLDATGTPPKEDTIVVANYREAMQLASKLSETGGFTGSKIRQLHQVLLKKTDHKGELGKYRTVDAWIGESKKTPIEDALYVAPMAPQIKPRMDNLLNYTNKASESPLVKVAVFHYMFEAIHPFEDGNGRIGRMLIPSLLKNLGMLSEPVLYSSNYFEKNKDQYKNELRKVDNTKDLNPWIKFFLNSIVQQCDESISLINSMLKLNDKLHKKYEHEQSPNIRRLIDLISERPILTIGDVSKILHVTRKTATLVIARLVKDKVIIEYKGAKGIKGAKLYLNIDLLDLIYEN